MLVAKYFIKELCIIVKLCNHGYFRGAWWIYSRGPERGGNLEIIFLEDLKK